MFSMFLEYTSSRRLFLLLSRYRSDTTLVTLKFVFCVAATPYMALTMSFLKSRFNFDALTFLRAHLRCSMSFMNGVK
jgi:hypothetical protein